METKPDNKKLETLTRQMLEFLEEIEANPADATLALIRVLAAIIYNVSQASSISQEEFKADIMQILDERLELFNNG